MANEKQFPFKKINKELFKFLDKSPNGFYAVANCVEELLEKGYTQLKESQPWKLERGKGYFVTRNGSSLIAFRVPKYAMHKGARGFQIYACHSDSPAFKLKKNWEIIVDKKYVKLNVEKYGGMLMSTWMDRPLSVAGRVLVANENGVESRLVNLDKDILMIPSLAIHMDSSANDGHKWNVQNDMAPLCGSALVQGKLKNMVAAAAGVTAGQILDMELYLYNRMPACSYGLAEEYIASGRLDDLQCAFAGLKGFLSAQVDDASICNIPPVVNVPVYCLYDNEEVGSSTRQGAASTFLKDTLERINSCLGGRHEEYLMALANSFMLSADNAHAVHPNYTDKADPTNRPYLNEGIVIKYSANQKYTTDAVAGALFTAICAKVDVPVQVFHNRSDMLGGSTLGNISNNQVAVKAVDIGLPQLAMHSAYESAGYKDTAYLVEAAKQFFSTCVLEEADGKYVLK